MSNHLSVATEGDTVKDVDLAERLPKATKTADAPQEKAKAPKVETAPISARGTILLGLAVVGTTFFGAGVWASTAPLASAVNAPGTVIIAGKRRTIQHLEGGIIKELHVREGQEVEAGQVLITLDPTQANATVMRLRNQLDTQLALEARLNAERNGDDAVTFPEELTARADDPKVSQILAGQRQEFDERRKTLVGTVELLQQKILQLDRIIDGLKSQRVSKEDQVGLIQEELGALQILLKKGLTNKSRVLELQRGSAQLNGDIGDIVAQIGRSEQQISEANMQIIQTSQQFREEVVAQLRETESKGADLRQQLLVAKDIVGRQEIRAPQSGTIQTLAVTTIGGVIAPGEVLMEIAPKDGNFLVEAQVSPLDIDNVSVGQEAEVRFSALDLRTTPVVMGKVISRSGDRIEAPNRSPFFRVQVETPPSEMKKLDSRKLQAGMPAEVLIQTGERTLINYLVKPLTDQLSRGMNEQ
ncbi:HlyD family type I secretion periplasmic adaptor subunit [Aurantimonas sp. DM33-3]|uniref:HlyD family type I secretion periplasmic adaptor subunit n=1 Tax=Aurantimonas sp. DM33-3 TaxID=2766955 RepID=UPI0016524453|nr:HlyD family type I secretion periplasmic adaptor subunit [Aurantimonas sp. DM33-3]MBC6718648.1 HlyD family type I secretion periplasmic adaptor subunit [Aurantimonas sp. DM33-3]